MGQLAKEIVRVLRKEIGEVGELEEAFGKIHPIYHSHMLVEWEMVVDGVLSGSEFKKHSKKGGDVVASGQNGYCRRCKPDYI
jgi:hypothetical protein